MNANQRVDVYSNQRVDVYSAHNVHRRKYGLNLSSIQNSECAPYTINGQRECGLLDLDKNVHRIQYTKGIHIQSERVSVFSVDNAHRGYYGLNSLSILELGMWTNSIWRAMYTVYIPLQIENTFYCNP